MISPNFFIGLPEDFNGKCKVYPPLVKEIMDNRYDAYRKLMTLSQEEIEDMYNEKKLEVDKFPTVIEYLLGNAYNDKRFEKVLMEAFQFFIKDEVAFLYEEKKILIGNLKKELKRVKKVEELVIIDENEFFDLQNMIRQSIGVDKVERPNPNEHPKIRAMKAKARYRDKIKAKKGMGISLPTILSSICCMGIGITPLNIGELSYCAVSELMSRYREKSKYELDINTLLAGGDSKKIKPKDWIRNLDD